MKIGSDANVGNVNGINNSQGIQPLESKKQTGSLNGLTVSQARTPSEQPMVRSNNANSSNVRAAGNVDKLTAAAAAPTPLPEGQTDKAYDGKIIGAGGKAYSQTTPLTQIPAVQPSNGKAPNETIIFVNGINTNKAGQSSTLQDIANLTGAQVIGVHNSTEGTFKDLAQSLGDKVNIGKNPAVDTIANTVYDAVKRGETIHLMGHSQGGLILSRALEGVKQRLMIEGGMSASQATRAMGNIKVETFGAAAGSYPDGPQYVHYVNRVDPVPSVFGLGSFKGIFDGDRKAGSNAVVHRFTDFSDVHSLNGTYFSQRVPFDQARRNQF